MLRILETPARRCTSCRTNVARFWSGKCPGFTRRLFHLTCVVSLVCWFLGGPRSQVQSLHKSTTISPPASRTPKHKLQTAKSGAQPHVEPSFMSESRSFFQHQNPPKRPSEHVPTPLQGSYELLVIRVRAVRVGLYAGQYSGPPRDFIVRRLS